MSETIFTAKVEAIITTNRGRFVKLKLESQPAENLVRFHIPSETLICGDRVKLAMNLHVKKQKPAPQIEQAIAESLVHAEVVE